MAAIVLLVLLGPAFASALTATVWQGGIASEAVTARANHHAPQKSDTIVSVVAELEGAIDNISDPNFWFNCAPGYDAPFGTRCPNHAWVDAMVKADPSPDKVIVDIGCNKGHDLVRWMEYWDTSSEHFWNSSSWTHYYDTVLHLKNYACPLKVLNTTANTTPSARVVNMSSLHAAALPVGVCVEPVQANVDLLRNASRALNYTNNTQFGSFHIVQAAVTDKAAPNQTTDFPDGVPGWEGGKIRNMVERPVNLTTVDGIVADLGLSDKVDILTIDTEGHDPAVINGAVSTLSSVRYLEFEVHRDFPNTAWAKTKLKTVVTDLHQKGFECYWAGAGGRLLNMNHCWDDKFERGTWANAACVKRNDPWSDVLRSYA